MSKLFCKLFGHSFIPIENSNWGKYYFGDGSKAHFLGTKISKLWCQRCHLRIDDIEKLVDTEAIEDE